MSRAGKANGTLNLSTSNIFNTLNTSKGPFLRLKPMNEVEEEEKGARETDDVALIISNTKSPAKDGIVRRGTVVPKI